MRRGSKRLAFRAAAADPQPSRQNLRDPRLRPAGACLRRAHGRVARPSFGGRGRGGSTRAGGFSDARDVGVVEPGASRVVLQTMLGGERTLPELDDDPIPRTC